MAITNPFRRKSRRGSSQRRGALKKRARANYNWLRSPGLGVEHLEDRRLLAVFGHTFTDINPDQSDLDGADPDGASMGRINGLANVAGDNTDYYAATEYGGVYKSSDLGSTWNYLEGHLPQTTWDVEVDPVIANRVYATSFYDARVDPITGIQVSTDGGVNWQHPLTAHADPTLEGTANDNTPQAGYNAIAARRNEPAAYGISIRPDDATNVAIGTNAGLAISTDSGVTWRIIDPTPATPATNVWDAVWQPGGPQGMGILDVVGDDGHLRSVDGGTTWTANNLPAGAFGANGSSISIVASPDESYVLYVAGVDNRLYESLDAGATWTQNGATDPVRGGGRIPFVAINDTTAGFDLWTGGISLYRVVGTTPAVPAPGGASRISPGGVGLGATPAGWFGGFTRAGIGAATGAHDDVGDIVFDGETAIDAVPRIMSSDGGVYWAQTTSAAPTSTTNLVWEQPTTGPHALWLFGMAGVDQPGANAEDIIFGTQDNGSFANTQAGAANTNNNWHNQDCCDVFDVGADDDTVLYTVGAFGGTARVFRLFLGTPGLAAGAQVNTYPGNVPAANVNAASGGQVTAFNSSESIVSFADDSYAVLMNDDGAFGDGGLHITNDITVNPIVWSELGNATEPVSNNFGEIQVANNGGTPSFFVSVGDGNGYTVDQLWRFDGTNPAGVWQRLDTNIDGGTGGVSLFAVDPNNANRIYASFIDPVTGPRMMFSTDGGATWNNDLGLDSLMTGGGAFQYQPTRGSRNFPDQENSGAPARGIGAYFQPTLLAFDPEDPNNVVAGGMDSGVFVSTDGGSSWRLLTDPFGNDEDVPHLPRPRFAHFDHDIVIDQTEIFIGTQGRGVWRIGVDFETDADLFDGGNPVSPADSNDSLGTATILGSLPQVTLRDLSIHDATDVDFFKITANQTGKLAVNMFFDVLLGDLDVRVRDRFGNIIATDSQSNIAPQLDQAQIVIPVVSQEEYFIEVYSAAGHTNGYDMEIENFAVPVPSGVHLDPASDTGMMNNDNNTNDNTPRLIIQADLQGFADMGVSILTSAQAAASVTAGAAVEVSITHSTTGVTTSGFANPIGASNLLFDFIPGAPLINGVYFAAASVKIFDGQQDAGGNPAPAIDRTELSAPLWLTIDTIVPGPSSLELLDSSDTGMLSNDFVINKMSPALSGVGEANAKIRVLANGIVVGQGTANSDGNWEITAEPLADGKYVFTVEQEDLAGNVSLPADPFVWQGLADVISNFASTGIEGATGAVIGNKLYVSHGFGPSAGGGDGKTLYIYDIESNTWTAGPDAGFDRGELMGATVGGKLYAIGGRTSPNTQIVEIFDPATSTWSQGANMPTGRGGAGATVASGLIHVVGGRPSGGPGSGPPLAAHEVYDPATDSWSTRAPLPIPVLDNYATVALGQKIYVMGGQSTGSGFLGLTQIYNTLTDTWSFGAPMPTPRSNAVAGVLNGKIVVAGGVEATFTNRDITEIYDPVTDTWTTGPVKPTPGSETAVNMSFTDSKLFVVGGGIFGQAQSVHEVLLATHLCVWIDTVEPNTPLLDLVEASDSGRHDADEITMDATPSVTMTFDDTIDGNGNPFPHDVKVRIYDRPGTAGTNGEVLIYDSWTLFGDFIDVGFLQQTLSSELNDPSGTGLAEGVHNLKMEVEDRAGNISHDFLITVTVDETKPPVSFGLPGLPNLADGLRTDSDSGVVTFPNTADDRITNDTSPTFWGLAEADAIVEVYVDFNGNGTIDATDKLLGRTVALPLDGNQGFLANGFWEITSVLDLNDPGISAALDGTRNLLVRAIDVAGNANNPNDGIGDAQQKLEIFLDTQAPRVLDVFATIDDAYNLFDPKPSVDGPTPVVNGLTIRFMDAPERGAAPFLYSAAIEALLEVPGNYALVGDHTGTVFITSATVVNEVVATGSAAAADVELTFSAALADDRYTLTVSDAIADVAGNRLDGESQTSAPFGENFAMVFPSGDRLPGGDFVARFTVDTRPELGSYASSSAGIDINGNFVWDPEGQDNDATNRDLTFTLPVTNNGQLTTNGFGVHDALFAGNFAPLQGTADGFDKLAAFGRLNGQFRFLIDTNNDGVVDTSQGDIFQLQNPAIVIDGLPFAGDFDGNAGNGDEVGLYNAGAWFLDTNRDFIIQPGEQLAGNNMLGYPIVGDFDGDGDDDLAVFNNDVFFFDLTGAADGTPGALDGTFDDTFIWGFSGVGERPVTADMNRDGIDDIGLWVPRNGASLPETGAEWYFLVSDTQQANVGTADALNHPFETAPFGNDLFAEFGQERSLPILGNFDPPVTGPVSSYRFNSSIEDGEITAEAVSGQAVITESVISDGLSARSASPQAAVEASFFAFDRTPAHRSSVDVAPSTDFATLREGRQLDNRLSRRLNGRGVDRALSDGLRLGGRRLGRSLRRSDASDSGRNGLRHDPRDNEESLYEVSLLRIQKTDRDEIREALAWVFDELGSEPTGSDDWHAEPSHADQDEEPRYEEQQYEAEAAAKNFSEER